MLLLLASILIDQVIEIFRKIVKLPANLSSRMMIIRFRVFDIGHIKDACFPLKHEEKYKVETLLLQVNI